MSKLPRKDIKIFGNTAPTADLRQFGSTREGTPVTSTDPDVLQALSNYEDAWNKGIIASLNIPPLEEFNTLQYLLSRELAYIQQVGIPEYSITTTYFANKSIVRTPEDSTLYKSDVDDNLGNDIVGVADYDAGTTYAKDDLAADTNGDIYRSLSAGNIGNALSNPTFWELTWIFLGDLENLKNLTQATETQEGLAKIITQANADLDVNDTDILTILKLVNRIATTSRKSIIELITQTEANANTDSTRAVTIDKILGRTVQIVNTQTGAVATTTTTIPFDDTIPQNTEGGEFMTLAITPKKASNILKIDVVVMATNSGGGNIAAALFQDSTANALAVASRQVTNNNNLESVISYNHNMVAGTTSSTTFKVRVGASNAGTLTFNGTASGSRRYGGAYASSITITEFAA